MDDGSSQPSSSGVFILATKLNMQAGILSVVIFVLFLLVWHVLTAKSITVADSTKVNAEQKSELTELGMTEDDIGKYTETGLVFEQIKQIAGLGLSFDDIQMAGGIESFGFTTGGAAEEAETGFPHPSLVWTQSIELLKNPLYDRGPNDKGIGIQLYYSLIRVAIGFGLAVLFAVPIGFLVGMSPIVNKALMPFIQILKPISPLAWLPLALYALKDSEMASIFVIFICSIWPMLINTAFGVAGVKNDYVNIARTLELSNLRTAFTVILPAAAPTIFTGMKISLGIAWLVIVAAEMLVGGIGMGYFVWNEWNGLNLHTMIFAILVIGVVGLMLDGVLGQCIRWVDYKE